MSREPDNGIKRCKKGTCTRATFVETVEGISVKFRHGKDVHPAVYTVEQMKVYLAARGYVVVEVAQVLSGQKAA